jgi:hypothetical protein
MHANGGVLVRFVENSPPFTHQSRSVPGYSFGEIAGFEPMIAALLVRRGVAVYAGPGNEAPADAPAQETEPRQESLPPVAYGRKLPGML